MRRADKWIAEDGTVFEGNDAYRKCHQYEMALREKKYDVLKNWIQFFNWQGKPMAYHLVKEGGYPTYARVLGIPSEYSDLWDVWCEVVPRELGDMLTYESDCGLWVDPNENNEWVRWEAIVREYEEKKEKVEKIMEGE